MGVKYTASFSDLYLQHMTGQDSVACRAYCFTGSPNLTWTMYFLYSKHFVLEFNKHSPKFREIPHEFTLKTLPDSCVSFLLKRKWFSDMTIHNLHTNTSSFKGWIATSEINMIQPQAFHWALTTYNHVHSLNICYIKCLVPRDIQLPLSMRVQNLFLSNRSTWMSPSLMLLTTWRQKLTQRQGQHLVWPLLGHSETTVDSISL